MSEVETKKRRFGFKRWIVLALIALGVYTAFLGPTIFRPISPVVVLPPEGTGLEIFGFPITNTILGTLIADLVVILLGLSAYRFHKSGQIVPSGVYNFFEVIVQFLWNTVEGAAGNKWGKRIFPVVATIFLLIFVANLSKLIPGYESFGQIKELHHGVGYAPVKLFTIGSLNVYTIDKGQPVEAGHADEEHAASDDKSAAYSVAAYAEGGDELCHSCEVVPFLRGAATDLNFPLALAISTVFLVQVFGVWALGPAYFEKFFQIRALVRGGILGSVNFVVGLLELILEFAKVLSFSFRLFGNIFAGTLLLSILGALTAVLIPVGLYFFEIFFGIIQAYVFFLLATMFISIALVSHHAEEHH